MLTKPINRSLITATLAAVLVSCGSETSPVSGGDLAGCATRAYDTIGGPISLTDHTGNAVSEADFKGQDSLIYFGFTYCPDVCPMTLMTTGAALEKLPETANKPRTILISVDPERDTPEQMALYIDSNGFPEDMVGLTGTPAQIKAAADAFKTSYKRIDLPDSAAGYTMDHLSILYLMDEDWKLKTFFTSEATPDDIAECITALG